MLPVAMACCSYDDNAKHCVLLVLWMTSSPATAKLPLVGGWWSCTIFSDDNVQGAAVVWWPAACM